MEFCLIFIRSLTPQQAAENALAIAIHTSKEELGMASPYIVRKIINKTFSGRFMLSRLSHYGFMGKIIDHLLFKDDDILYLPRDNAIPVNQKSGSICGHGAAVSNPGPHHRKCRLPLDHGFLHLPGISRLQRLSH